MALFLNIYSVVNSLLETTSTRCAGRVITSRDLVCWISSFNNPADYIRIRLLACLWLVGLVGSAFPPAKDDLICGGTTRLNTQKGVSCFFYLPEVVIRIGITTNQQDVVSRKVQGCETSMYQLQLRSDLLSPGVFRAICGTRQGTSPTSRRLDNEQGMQQRIRKSRLLRS